MNHVSAALTILKEIAPEEMQPVVNDLTSGAAVGGAVAALTHAAAGPYAAAGAFLKAAHTEQMKEDERRFKIMEEDPTYTFEMTPYG